LSSRCCRTAMPGSRAERASRVCSPAMVRCARGAVSMLLSGALTIALTGRARADRYELGAFFGPRIFSKDAQLGYVSTAVGDTLSTGVALGVRYSLPLVKWFAVDVELPIATTSTTPNNIDVFW